MDKRLLMQIMYDGKFLEFGATITGEEFRAFCEIKEIDVGTKEDFANESLLELSFADHIRNQLLNQGKYFKQERGGYRVLLPSENYEQVLTYMRAADQKLKRGIKLDKNTPAKYTIDSSSTARMILKQESIKKRLNHER